MKIPKAVARYTSLPFLHFFIAAMAVLDFVWWLLKSAWIGILFTAVILSIAAAVALVPCYFDRYHKCVRSGGEVKRECEPVHQCEYAGCGHVVIGYDCSMTCTEVLDAEDASAIRNR